MNQKIIGRTTYEQIYEKLSKIINLDELIKKKALKFKSTGFMDLNFDFLRFDEQKRIIIVISHYFKQNGDMVADPDMEIRIDKSWVEYGGATCEALTFQDAYKYQEVYSRSKSNEIINSRLKTALNKFLLQWLKNNLFLKNLKNFVPYVEVVHPVYTNDPLNMYLILGSHNALLLDTGCGLYPLKLLVDDLIGKRNLLVFKSHSHWDHPLGNVEFGEVYIHENEVDIISKPYDVSYFKDSPNEIVKIYAEKNFLIPTAKTIKPLKDGDAFDLGEIEIKVIHCPGHSPGSICLLTNTGELFTSDVAYYGDQFLPKRDDFPVVLKSLSKLIELCEKQENLELYPSHRSYPCDITLITDLYKGIENIENLWDTKKPFDFFEAWQIDDESGKFRYYISRI